MKNPKSNTNTQVAISPSLTLTYPMDTYAANFYPASYWHHTGTKKMIKKTIKTLPQFLNIKNWYQQPPGMCKTWYQNNTGCNSFFQISHNFFWLDWSAKFHKFAGFFCFLCFWGLVFTRVCRKPGNKNFLFFGAFWGLRESLWNSHQKVACLLACC
jgi:hypothetical protein